VPGEKLYKTFQLLFIELLSIVKRVKKPKEKWPRQNGAKWGKCTSLKAAGRKFFKGLDKLDVAINHLH